MNSDALSSVENNLSNGCLIGEDFGFLRDIWDTLSPGAQQEIIELSQLSSQYMDSAISTATSANAEFPSIWKTYTMQLIKKQMQNLEQEERENETSLSLSAML